MLAGRPTVGDSERGAVVAGDGGPVFGADFLLALGDDVEETPRPAAGGPDPLTGVLAAMSRTPDTALAFLGPPTAGEGADADTTRLENLSTRDWDAPGLAAWTAAVAASSSLRTSTDTATAARADEVAGTAVHELAGHATGNADSYGDAVKTNVGLLLAACPDGIVAAWGADPDGAAPGAGALVDGQGRSLGTATVSDLEVLVGRLLDTPSAVGQISGALGASAVQLSAQGDDPTADAASRVASMTTVYARAARAVAHVLGMMKAAYDHGEVFPSDSA